jgi:impB/mucB/samB family C-terminal domain
LAKVPLPTLMKFFSPETAEHVFQVAQGIDNEAVKETSGALVKSITSFKSFPAMKNVTDIRNWLVVLSQEISERVYQDTVRNHRYPKTCTLNYSFYTTPAGTRPSGSGSARGMRQSRSVRLVFPSERESIDQKSDSLVDQSMQKVEEILKQQHKLCGIGLAASNFEMRGPPQGMASIQSFFQKKDDESSSSSMIQTQRELSRSPLMSNRLGRPAKKRPRNGITTFFSSMESKSFNEESESKSHSIEPSFVRQTQASTNMFDSIEPRTTETGSSSDADRDLELARRLQAQYDRENYVISKSEANIRNRQALPTSKKKATPKIDSFFKTKKQQGK